MPALISASARLFHARGLSLRWLTVSCQIAMPDWYCALRRQVSAPSSAAAEIASTSTSNSAESARSASVSPRRRASRSPARKIATTATAAIAASGRYIRCSNARSLIGMKLEVGARIRKNHAPANPHVGLPAVCVAGRRASASDRGREEDSDHDRAGQDIRQLLRHRPVVVQAEAGRPECQREVMENHARLALRVLERRDARELEPGRERMRADRLGDRAPEEQPVAASPR